MDIGLATNVAHPIGFLTGSVVYALLLAMVLQATGSTRLAGRPAEGSWRQRMRLPLYMAVFGLIWNLASLAALLVAEVSGVAEPAFLLFLATAALGSLPAVAMHSVWQTVAAGPKGSVGALTIAGYSLSIVTAIWNGVALISGDPVPDTGAWWLLTVGFLLLFLVLLVVSKQTLAGHGGLVVVFLAVCSVVALPLSHHPDSSLPWWFDFLGHHASLPVAVAVLYRDYRFAFVDHFIKRTLSFLLLVGMSFGLYVAAVLPLLRAGENGAVSPASSGLVVTLWVLTALAYPWMHQQVIWVFDALLLHRPDYQELRRQLVQRVDERDTLDAVLSELCQSLQQALRSQEVRWGGVADIPSLPGLPDGRGTGNARESSGRADVTGPLQTSGGGIVDCHSDAGAPTLYPDNCATCGWASFFVRRTDAT